jgi:hypothetical protein
MFALRLPTSSVPTDSLSIAMWSLRNHTYTQSLYLMPKLTKYFIPLNSMYKKYCKTYKDVHVNFEPNGYFLETPCIR